MTKAKKELREEFFSLRIYNQIKQVHMSSRKLSEAEIKAVPDWAWVDDYYLDKKWSKKSWLRQYDRQRPGFDFGKALQQQREEMGEALRKIIKERIAYGKEYRLKNKDSLRNGWSSIESGPCCDKCRMDKKAVAKSGRAVALRLMVGCTNPFQSKKICECHLPFRKVAEESIQKELKNILFNLDTYLKQND